MKRFICLFALLLISDYNLLNRKYYVAIIFQNNQCYEEYMTYRNILHVVGDFVNDLTIQSIHIIKDV